MATMIAWKQRDQEAVHYAKRILELLAQNVKSLCTKFAAIIIIKNDVIQIIFRHH